MRNAAQRKLQSQAGASLFIALLFFLVALTVGAVILTAAVTDAGRIARNRQEQQAYLAVSSAAMLVREDLREAALTIRYQAVTTKTTTTVMGEDGNPYNVVTTTGPVYSKLSADLSGESKLLEDTPKDDLAQLYYSTVPVFSETASAAMEYELKITAEPLPDVFGSIKVDQTDGGRYTITAILYTRAEGDAPVNTMTLRFTPAVHETQTTIVNNTDDTETTTTTYTAALTWGTPFITKGATL